MLIALAAIAALVSLAWSLTATLLGERPTVYAHRGARKALKRAAERLRRVCHRAPIWAHLGHVQTAYAMKLRRSSPHIVFERHTVALPSGACIALDTHAPTGAALDAPIALVVPGIAGSSAEHYVRNLVDSLTSLGWPAVVFNHRGCGGSPLLTSRLFTFGHYDDLAHAVDAALELFGAQRKVVIVGCSMGGNIVCNYVADQARVSKNVVAAASISQGYDAEECGDHLPSYAGKFLLKKMLKLVDRHFSVLSTDSRFDINQVKSAKNCAEFDTFYTLPANDFEWKTPREYYRDSSCFHNLHKIKIPVLLLNAIDDPMIPEHLLIRTGEMIEKKCPNIVMTTLRKGGHLSFARGWIFPQRESFADHAVKEFFVDVVAAH